MSMTTVPMPPGEWERLTACVREPIRFAGAIQPHGLFLAARESDLTITHASDNTERLIGIAPEKVLGNPLSTLLGDETIASLRAVLDPETVAANPTKVTIAGVAFDAIASMLGDNIVVELEPAMDPAGLSYEITAMREAFRSLSRATTVRQLWDQTAVQFRRITGFDRVMIYHFYPDDHGEVVAECAAEDMEPYLGLQFPASDIPAQARELYLTKTSRMIASSSGEIAALLADFDETDVAALDLTHIELRAVSPHHLEFMRNMGQACTFSLSLISDHKLVGMITCAHRTERRIAYFVREGLEIMAIQISLQLANLREIERLEKKSLVRETRANLLLQVERAEDLPNALLQNEFTLLDLIPADGASVFFGGHVETRGHAPSNEQIVELGALLESNYLSSRIVSTSLKREHPVLAALLPGIAGIIIQPLGSTGDFLAWYRNEVTQTVRWLGDMSLDNRMSTLSPRASFSAWSQEVSGSAYSWDGLDREAVSLSRDLDSILLHRAQSELAEAALRDPLTGLPNRRLLMDRLEHELARRGQGHGLAVLFIDVDRFKQINDTYGHSAGDAALVHVAQSLKNVARGEDTIARLGGDEFVVLCAGASLEQAERIAKRIEEAIETFPQGNQVWSITVSVGIALADDTSDASQILSMADAAMYLEKSKRRLGEKS